MADLFDVSIGGAGFHLTSHIIALAALFIACFAIAGYISFRSNSIPGKALKDHDADFEDVTADSLALGSMVEKIYYKRFSGLSTTDGIDANDSLGPVTPVLPQGCIITEQVMKVVTVGTNFGNLSLDLETATLAAYDAAANNPLDADTLASNATGTARIVLDTVVGATKNVVCLTSVSAGTANGNEVFDVYVRVLFPVGVTPV